MRRQTMLTRIVTNASEEGYAWMLVCLRIAVAVALFLIASQTQAMMAGQEALPLAPLGFIAWHSVLARTGVMTLFVSSIAFVLGLATRPAAAFSVLVLVLATISQMGTNLADGMLAVYAMLMISLGFGLAGGWGNVAGLNGLLLQNIRRPMRWIIFLLG